jgi:hypothetical protein
MTTIQSPDEKRAEASKRNLAKAREALANKRKRETEALNGKPEPQPAMDEDLQRYKHLVETISNSEDSAMESSGLSEEEPVMTKKPSKTKKPKIRTTAYVPEKKKKKPKTVQNTPQPDPSNNEEDDSYSSLALKHLGSIAFAMAGLIANVAVAKFIEKTVNTTKEEQKEPLPHIIVTPPPPTPTGKPTDPTPAFSFRQ